MSKKRWGGSLADSAADIDWQLDRLVWPGWLARTPVRWIREFPRYLEAVAVRMKKIDDSDPREGTHLASLRPAVDRMDRWEAAGYAHWDPAVAAYRWMLEEYRVSMFAQPLGTSIKVSGKRLEREWERSMSLVERPP